MFNPQYRLLITAESFSDQFICLGSQLVSLVNFLQGILPTHKWFGANVNAIGKGVTELNINGFQLKFIGSDQKLIQCCSEITQFIWGVFLCIHNDYSSSNISDSNLEQKMIHFDPYPVREF